jgi:hypothetical protein
MAFVAAMNNPLTKAGVKGSDDHRRQGVDLGLPLTECQLQQLIRTQKYELVVMRLSVPQ